MRTQIKNRATRLGFLLLGALASIGSLCRGAGAETNDTVRLDLRVPSTIVQGLPCLISLEIQNRPGYRRLSDAEIRRLSNEDCIAYVRKFEAASIVFLQDHPFKPEGPLTIQVNHAGSGQPVKKLLPPSDPRPPPPYEGLRDTPRTTVIPGDSTQVIFDISAALAELPPTNYTVTLTLHTLQGEPPTWVSLPSRSFRLMRLSESQVKSVQDVFPEFQPLVPPVTNRNELPYYKLDYYYWLRGATGDLAKARSTLPKEVTDQLAAHLFVAKVAQVGAVAKMTAEDLDHFPPHLQGLADVFKYEVLYRQGKKEAAEQVWEAARANHRALPSDYFYNARRSEPSNTGIELGVLETLLRHRPSAAQRPN